jgi:hypothetical protein
MDAEARIRQLMEENERLRAQLQYQSAGPLGGYTDQQAQAWGSMIDGTAAPSQYMRKETPPRPSQYMRKENRKSKPVGLDGY